MRGNADWQSFGTPLGFIRLVLLVDWDPIGVFGYPKAMDEYDIYADEIYGLLQTGIAKHKIIEHMRNIEKQKMGVRGHADLDKVVSKLKQVHQMSQEKAQS